MSNYKLESLRTRVSTYATTLCEVLHLQRIDFEALVGFGRSLLLSSTVK